MATNLQSVFMTWKEMKESGDSKTSPLSKPNSADQGLVVSAALHAEKKFPPLPSQTEYEGAVVGAA